MMMMMMIIIIIIIIFIWGSKADLRGYTDADM